MSNLATVTPINRDIPMPSENGYVKLWRDVNNQSWSLDALPYAVFTKLLTFVQHKPRVIEKFGIKIPLQPGEFAMSWSDVVAMFREIKDKSHARRTLKKFTSLRQMYLREVKKGNVHHGFVLGFSDWKKWQNSDTPSDTHSDTPQVNEYKALSGVCDTHADTPSDTQRNKNVSNKIKDNASSSNQLEHFKKEVLQERQNAFEHFWKTWSDCKKLIGSKNTAPKAKVKLKFLQEFTQLKVESMGLESFCEEIDKLCNFAWLTHKSIADCNEAGVKSDWFNHATMYPQRFLSNAQWRENQ